MNNVPNHVAIIMDGNRRWAKARGKVSSFGHRQGLETLINLAEYIFKKGTNILSVYAFSTENFKRSESEVNSIMELFVNNIDRALKKLLKGEIRVVFSGRRNNLKKEVLDKIVELEEKTKNNNRATFNICFNYGGHAEIVDAVKKIVEQKVDVNQIDENLVNDCLYNILPSVDLMIRTGGEIRLSNFLLWQNSYAEFYFTDTLFPDFIEEEYDKAIEEFLRRKRNYGGDRK